MALMFVYYIKQLLNDSKLNHLAPVLVHVIVYTLHKEF